MWATKMTKLMKKPAVFVFLILFFIAGCTHTQTGTGKKGTVKSKLELTDNKLIRVINADAFIAVKHTHVMSSSTIDLHKDYISILSSSIRIMKSFYSSAIYLRKHNKIDDLQLLEEFAREYMSSRIDPLLRRKNEIDNLEVKKVMFELQHLKARLCYQFQDITQACETFHNLDSQYYKDIDKKADVIVIGFKKQKPYLMVTDFKYICNKDKAQ